MIPLALLRHPILFCGITIPEFLKWYYVDEPWRIVKSYLTYLRAFNEIFSFVFLVRTLFSPWKQIKDAYPQSILHLDAWSQALVLNITARIIGALVRSIAFCIGIVVQCVVFFGFGVYLGIWIAFPFIFWIGCTFVFAAVV